MLRSLKKFHILIEDHGLYILNPTYAGVLLSSVWCWLSNWACDVCLCFGTQVNCSSRGLHYVPGSIPGNTTSLNLSHNQIHCIKTSAFIGLDKLLELDLSWNDLQTVEPTILQHTNALRNLNLQSNLLTELPQRLLIPTPMLISLSISNNSLKLLPKRFFRWLPHFKNLTAAKNPWLCDCEMLHFANWIKRKPDISTDSNNLLCSNSDETVVTTDYTSCMSTHDWPKFFHSDTMSHFYSDLHETSPPGRGKASYLHPPQKLPTSIFKNMFCRKK
uniref:LRRNT domain-containing protein n=1 Tax=Eptatretus burgeri TaxID=7764 RepID=A0A8C4QFU0_EPTBU